MAMAALLCRLQHGVKCSEELPRETRTIQAFGNKPEVEHKELMMSEKLQVSPRPILQVFTAFYIPIYCT